MVTELAMLRRKVTTDLNELKDTIEKDQNLSYKLDEIANEIENLQIQPTRYTTPNKKLPQVDKRIPTFHGNHDNFDKWIYQIDNFYDFYYLNIFNYLN